jgi:hypothetical protein
VGQRFDQSRIGYLAKIAPAGGRYSAAVSRDTDLERWEITTAIIGLRGAYKRCMDAYRDLIPNQAIAGVSVVEFVFWACALDERLCKADPAYAARRDRDRHGQVLPALRFTRDRHTHQVAITTSLEFMFERSSDPDASPDLLKVLTRWRPLDGITQPGDGRHETTPQYRKRRDAYKEHLEGRKPALALRDALDFLDREVAARGIKVPDPIPWPEV